MQAQKNLFACDLCGKQISQEERLRYVVKIEVFAAHDPAELTEEDFDDVIAEIQAAAARGRAQSSALDVKVEYYRSYPSATFDPDSSYAQRMREAYKLVQGYKDEDFVRAGAGGSTDMADIAQVCQTDQFVRCGLGRALESNAHGADENIRVSDLLAHTKELVWYLAE